MTSLLKTIYTFSADPINFPVGPITKIRKKNPKVHLTPLITQDSQIVKANLRKMKGTARTFIPDFPIYYKAILL